MSTNATNPASTAPPAPVQPVPNLNAIIHPMLNSMMLGHTFLTLLLPLFIALFYFSTPESRRRPIFILNVVAIILAFTAGVMIDAFSIHSILDPLSPWSPSVNIAIGILGAFQSILVDLILLVRLILVHPLRQLGPIRFALLTTLPVLLKIARVVNMSLFIKVLADAARGPSGAQNMAIVWATTPYLKIEWSAQMVDNAYASLAFLWSIRDVGNAKGVTSDIHPNRVTFAQRMRMLFRIALSNFVVPSLFSIAQLVVVYRNVDVLIVNEIVLVNTMLAVFGVVFATVWAGNVGRKLRRVEVEAEWRGQGPRRARRVSGADGVNVQWEEDKSFQTDDDDAKRPTKRAAGAFAFPGLGTWHAASSPPSLSFNGSVAECRGPAGDGPLTPGRPEEEA